MTCVPTTYRRLSHQIHDWLHAALVLAIYAVFSKHLARWHAGELSRGPPCLFLSCDRYGSQYGARQFLPMVSVLACNGGRGRFPLAGEATLDFPPQSAARVGMLVSSGVRRIWRPPTNCAAARGTRTDTYDSNTDWGQQLLGHRSTRPEKSRLRLALCANPPSTITVGTPVVN